MSNIPAARADLERLARKCPPGIARRIRSIATKRLHRRPQHVRTRALGTRAKMTPALGLRIKRWYHAHPTWDQQRIAEKFNVTDARVSIVLWGKNK